MPSKHTILVIDDDQKLCRTLAQILRRAGFSVITASQLSQAHRYLYLRSFDLIIIDSNSPDQAGLDRVHELHCLFSSIPIVLITNIPLDDPTLTARQIGVCSYLVKPIDPASILACVDEILVHQ